MKPPDQTARRIVVISILASAMLSAAKIGTGWIGRSAAVVADGMESAGDVLSSGIVFMGILLAAKPADENHPYGHGRIEILSGLAVGILLTLAGAMIGIRSIDWINEPHLPPRTFVLWVMAVSIGTKCALAAAKLYFGAKLRSSAIRADGWNDFVDILSGAVALIAAGLAIWQPGRFLAADHIGGFLIGLIVVFLGIRVCYETSMQLMDTMPDDATMRSIREAALREPGALGVEKCFARKTGLRYHVDLHLEVDPDLTVFESHEIAQRVRQRIQRDVDCVADVLVHVEPFARLHAARP